MEWISINNENPPFGLRVLTYTPNTELTFEEYRVIVFGSIAGGFPYGVTHWMRLPEPPNINTNG